MTSYGKDPVTGKPLFRDSDAPDIKQDPQEAADYAAEVGNYIVGTTAYLDAYPYQHEGLEGFDTTQKVKKRVDASGGWKRMEPTGGFFVDATSATGTATVVHDLGKIPSRVIVTDRNGGAIPAQRKVVYVTATASQIQFVVYNSSTGNALTSNPVEFFWEAWP